MESQCLLWSVMTPTFVQINNDLLTLASDFFDGIFDGRRWSELSLSSMAVIKMLLQCDCEHRFRKVFKKMFGNSYKNFPTIFFFYWKSILLKLFMDSLSFFQVGKAKMPKVIKFIVYCKYRIEETDNAINM